MLYLIAFVANDIIDQEPWKLLSVDSVDHLKRVEIRLLCKKGASGLLPSRHRGQCPVCDDADSSDVGRSGRSPSSVLIQK